MKTYLLLLIISLYNLQYDTKPILTYYVSTTGLDSNPGNLNQPFKTIEKAKLRIRELGNLRRNYSEIIVYIRGGIYNLKHQINFNNKDSGGDELVITYASFNDEEVVFSGGKKLEGIWTKVANSKLNKWKLFLPDLNKDTSAFFTQLFRNGSRAQRASSKVFFTNGPIKQYKNAIQPYNFRGIDRLRSLDILPFCTFNYINKDLNALKELNGVEIIINHSWESTWHQIHSVDTREKNVYLKTPMLFPIGFFANNTSYRIENSIQFFDEPGEWFLSKAERSLYYIAKENENPNEVEFYIPVLQNLIVINGTVNSPVTNLKFSGITFKHTKAARGVSMLTLDYQNRLIDKYNWLDFNTGYSSEQTAPNSGEAIKINYGISCEFSKCTFSQLGGYAINIGKYSKDNLITQSNFTDLGSGGVMVGINEKDPLKKKIPFASSPSNNTISYSTFHSLGKVQPSGVAIAIIQSHGNTINNNKIFDLPYSGISIGWSFGSMLNFTRNNTIIDNHIYDVMKLLADGGGIYTLGVQDGTLIGGNYIHDVRRSNTAIGAQNNAVFFDHGSSGITMRNNLLGSTPNRFYRFNLSDSLKIDYQNNFLGEKSENDEFRLKVIKNSGHNKR